MWLPHEASDDDDGGGGGGGGAAGEDAATAVRELTQVDSETAPTA